jgi:hypothetical protein
MRWLAHQISKSRSVELAHPKGADKLQQLFGGSSKTLAWEGPNVQKETASQPKRMEPVVQDHRIPVPTE